MAEFYNTLSVMLIYPDPALPPMSMRMTSTLDAIRTAFADQFRSVYDQKGGIVFEDGSSWHPTKFTNSQGAEY